ncbi:MAG: hypothetical protein KBA06_00010 [Saprospiraceae bacterium]|nr:hypothetical protein [Saprospiraceae bacterium]
MKTSILRFVLFVCISLSYIAITFAQCPMCKISAESNLQNGGSTGNGLNTGILYMLSLPYLLVAFIGYRWWKSNKVNEKNEVVDNDISKWN